MNDDLINKLKYISNNPLINGEYDEENYLFDDEAKALLDYITNLQEENEEFRLLKERYQLIKEIYKERIDKAIEYIKSPKICIDIRKTDGTLDFVSTDELLNILGGEE